MRKRKAVRGLVFAGNNEILLMKLHLARKDLDIWIAPGGGVEGEEDYKSALRRELYEETGIEEIEIGRLVWKRRDVFELNDEIIDQEEDYYLCTCERFDAHPVYLEEGDERESFRCFKWWSIDEIRESGEIFVPQTLAENLDCIMKDRNAEPFEVGR